MAIAEELVAAADRELVPQQRLGRHEDERLAERAQHLAAQDVEIIGRRRDVADLDIVAGAQLQESFEPRGTMLRSLPFIRSEEHTSELQSLMRISYAVFCLKKKTTKKTTSTYITTGKSRTTINTAEQVKH